MANLLQRDEWIALSRLYIAGKPGVVGNGRGFPRAGAWTVLRTLRNYDPPLAREAFRLRDKRGQHFMVITDAGIAFYEQHERLYRGLYPGA